MEGSSMRKETIGIYSHYPCKDAYYIFHIPYDKTDAFDGTSVLSSEVENNIRYLIDLAYKQNMPDGSLLDYRDYFPT